MEVHEARADSVSLEVRLDKPAQSIRQHTSAYVTQHTEALEVRLDKPAQSIRQHTSAHVSIRQHTSQSIRKHS